MAMVVIMTTLAAGTSLWPGVQETWVSIGAGSASLWTKDRLYTRATSVIAAHCAPTRVEASNIIVIFWERVLPN